MVELLWQVANHFNHIHVAMGEGGGALAGAGAQVEELDRAMIKGPKGRIKDMAQAAADKVHGAANAFIQKHAPQTVGGVGNVDNGPIQQMAKAMVMQRWGAGQWSPFVSLEMAEAGWNPYATNPDSGAYGIPQALPPSKLPPAGQPGANVSETAHAKAQLGWMMQYISERYGDPAGAWAWHQANNWYRKGGIVGLQGGGIPEVSLPGTGMFTTASFGAAVPIADVAAEFGIALPVGGGGGGPAAPLGVAGIGVPSPKVKDLKGLVGKLFGSDKAEDRRQMTRKFSDQVKAAGITVGAEREIANLQSAVTNYGLNADAAGQVTASPGTAPCRRRSAASPRRPGLGSSCGRCSTCAPN